MRDVSDNSEILADETHGGYPLEAQAFQRKKIALPFKDATTIDTATTIELIRQKHPSLVFLGCSFMPFPHPVEEIAEAVHETLDTEGVGVVMEAQHLCMVMRGVEKEHSIMTTSRMLGSFRAEGATRNEFLKLIN